MSLGGTRLVLTSAWRSGIGLAFATILLASASTQLPSAPNRISQAPVEPLPGGALSAAASVVCDPPPGKGWVDPSGCAGGGGLQALAVGPLVYSTFLGGSGDDAAYPVGPRMFVGADGSAYLVGGTSSVDFPVTANAYDRTLNGTQDIFVAKVDPGGTGLAFSTYLGGSGTDLPVAMAVGADGTVFVGGQTTSMDFPTTAGALQTTPPNASAKAFIARLSADGSSLVYSTFLNSSTTNLVADLAVDAEGSAYFVASGQMTLFNASFGMTQTSYTFPGPGYDRWLGKINAAGNTLEWAGVLGGSAYDTLTAIELDAYGNLTLAGHTNSSDFPATLGAFDRSLSLTDAFVAKINVSSTALVAATLLGGVGSELEPHLVVDVRGSVYVGGWTSSNDFPTTTGAVQTSYAGGVGDGFLTKLAPDLSALVYSTYLGGAALDKVEALALTSDGRLAASGPTASVNFPVTPDGQNVAFVFSDVFLTVLDPAGASLWYSSLTNASMCNNCLLGLGTDAYDLVHLAGPATNPAMTVTADALDPTYNQRDVFLQTYDLNQNLTRYDLTVTSAPSGLAVGLGKGEYTTPVTLSCIAGSSHLITTPPFQTSARGRHTFVNWSDGGEPGHVLDCVAPTTVTANFASEWLVNVFTSPPGLVATFDAVRFTSSASFWLPEGTAHSVGTTPNQTLTDTRYAFASWSDGGPLSHAITVGGPSDFVATFSAAEYLVTVAASSAGLSVLVDGSPVTGSQAFWWTAGSTHQLGLSSPQAVSASERAVFVAWSDGGAQNHSVVAAAPGTLSALTAPEYLVSVTTSPEPFRVSVDGLPVTAPQFFWWKANETHRLGAPAAPQDSNSGLSRFTPFRWSDLGAPAHDVSVTGAASFQAIFVAAEHLVRLETEPPGLGLLVDGALVGAPASFWWAASSTHSLAALPAQGESGGSRYAWTSWQDGGALNHSVSVNGPISMVADHRLQFLLTLSSDHGAPACDVLDCWYDEGTSATLSAASPVGGGVGTRFVLRGWLGADPGPGGTAIIVMDGPQEATADWGTEYLLTVETAHGVALGSGWHPAGSIVPISVAAPEVDEGGTKFQFAGWSGDSAAADPSTTVTMTRPLTLAAQWQIPPVAGGVGPEFWFALMVIIGAAVGFSPRVRYSTVGFLAVPLFMRLRRDEVKNQFHRGRLIQFVADHPGAHFSEIRRKLTLSNGACAYHLRVLEKTGQVRRVAHGTMVRFYPTDYKSDAEALPPLGYVQRQLLGALMARGEGTAGELAAPLSEGERSVQLATVSYHLRELSRKKDLISARREGRNTVYYLTDEQRAYLGRRLKEEYAADSLFANLDVAEAMAMGAAFGEAPETNGKAQPRGHPAGAVPAHAPTFFVEEAFAFAQGGELVARAAARRRGSGARPSPSKLDAVRGSLERAPAPGAGAKDLGQGDQHVFVRRGNGATVAAVVFGDAPREVFAALQIAAERGVDVLDGASKSDEARALLEHELRTIVDLSAGWSQEQARATLAANPLALLSETDFVAGFVRLKVAARNRGTAALSDLGLELDYPEAALRFERANPDAVYSKGRFQLGSLRPGEKKAIEFYFDPQVCVESFFDADLKFRDGQGNFQNVRMKQRAVQVECPLLLTRSKANTASLRNLVDNVLRWQDAKVFRYPVAMGPEPSFEVAKEVIASFDVQSVRDFVDIAPFHGEAWFYGETKVRGTPLVARTRVAEATGTLEFFVAGASAEAVTGLLAELGRRYGDLLRQRKGLPGAERVTERAGIEEHGRLPMLLYRERGGGGGPSGTSP